MKKVSKILFLLLLLSVLGYSLNATYAEVPHLINYQGRLTDTSGVPLNGSYNLTFRIYDAETAGNLLWEETQTGVVINKGIFAALLGSVTNLNIAFDKPYFLEIKVGNEVMTPRQRITSAGYAIRAEKAENAQNAERVGSNASPGNSKYYGTDAEGKRDWYSLPAIVNAVGTSNITTNSTSYVDMQDMSATVTGSGTYVVLFTGPVYTAYNSRTSIEISIDGVQKTWGSVVVSSYNEMSEGGGKSLHWSGTLGAGNHVIKVRWKTNSSANCNSTINGDRVLTVMKIS